MGEQPKDRAPGVLWAVGPGVLVIGGILALVLFVGWFMAVPITPDLIPALIWIVVFSAVAACALLEIAKRVLYLRGYFHARQLKAWMRKRIEATLPVGSDAAEEAATERAFDDLMVLALGTAPRRRPRKSDPDGHRNTFGVAQTEYLDAPTEQLAAQLSDLGELVLASPVGHPDLMVVFTGRDPEAASKGSPQPSMPTSTSRGAEPLPDPTDDWNAALLNAALQRGIESFQIIVSQRWRRTMQLSAVVLAGVIGWATAMLVPGAAVMPITLASFVVGGFLAWVVRDLSAGAARWRDR
ncbi:hypothetical protein GE115_10135 [Agromyces sp. CFH 90414]|uniref:Uncharacterized protein n=1 Tax=Agromyces agglutinans TaxID=2662258 RepID=A0A6I2FEA1_9MICO|nr:hypothetical protein [Agromyces agglutinans]MRG60223.1 hypothetical protein [Agromyces agglutinans]